VELGVTLETVLSMSVFEYAAFLQYFKVKNKEEKEAAKKNRPRKR
jgi:hypothetical protein